MDLPITPIDKDFLADEILKETRPEQKAKLIAAKTKHDNLKQVIAQLWTSLPLSS